MIVTALLAVSVAQTPVKLASPGLASVNMQPELASFYSEHFAAQLKLTGMRVVTQSEIQSLLGFERQKELLGCSTGSSACSAELANALGVDGIVTGQVGKFGDKYQANLNILNAVDGQPLSFRSFRVAGDEQFLDALSAAAKEMSREVHKALKREVAAEQAKPVATVSGEAGKGSGSTLRTLGWIPIAAGAVALGVSGYLHYDADRMSGALTSGALPPGMTAEQVRERGKSQQTLGYVTLGVGLALAGAGAAMMAFGGGAQPTAAITPDGSFMAGIAGELP